MKNRPKTLKENVQLIGVGLAALFMSAVCGGGGYLYHEAYKDISPFEADFALYTFGVLSLVTLGTAVFAFSQVNFSKQGKKPDRPEKITHPEILDAGMF
jgi:hypothetical protein